jgi:hypothetical protein
METYVGVQPGDILMLYLIEISDRSLMRILHKDLNFHPYKMVVVQELSNFDMANRSAEAER